MGEVYRADDLKLGQQVALKFLPPEVDRDPARLTQLHTEVRMARQVSHPNVCRVYDIDEVEGHTFLSMEYVDGEDLASLLRRIGRFPDQRDHSLRLAERIGADQMRALGKQRDGRQQLLHLIRRIEADVGGNEIRLTDRVVNHGFYKTPHMYCYHINVGHPVLDEGARYLVGCEILKRLENDPAP